MSEIDGMDALKAKLAAIRERLENPEGGIKRAALVPLKAAAERIDAGGPGWAPNRTGTPLLHRTGRLLRSLTVGNADGVLEVDGTTLTVGTNVEYARYLQEGTRRMPARPFLVADDKVTDAMSAAFFRWLVTGGSHGE